MTTNTEKIDGLSPEMVPCPFGHAVERGVSIEIDDEEWNIATVICGDCGTRGPYVDLDDYPHHRAAEISAVSLWNTRTAQDSAMGERVRELEQRLAALQQAEATYRYAHDILGTGDPKTGRAWDLMHRAGDDARVTLANQGAHP